jgi:hypothetical protein
MRFVKIYVTHKNDKYALAVKRTMIKTQCMSSVSYTYEILYKGCISNAWTHVKSKFFTPKQRKEFPINILAEMRDFWV